MVDVDVECWWLNVREKRKTKLQITYGIWSIEWNTIDWLWVWVGNNSCEWTQWLNVLFKCEDSLVILLQIVLDAICAVIYIYFKNNRNLCTIDSESKTVRNFNVNITRICASVYQFEAYDAWALSMKYWRNYFRLEDEENLFRIFLLRKLSQRHFLSILKRWNGAYVFIFFFIFGLSFHTLQTFVL